MTTAKIAQAAAALLQARQQCEAIAPLASQYQIQTLDEAYQVAALNIQARLTEPKRRVVGKKVGLTSIAVQQQLGVDQPDFGILLDDMEVLNGQAIDTRQLLQPKAEAEVAFVLGRDLMTGTRPSYGEFLACLAYALPAIEIVDSAIADWKISLVDTVADNASCGLYVLGDQPVSVAHLSLGDLGMNMTKDGILASVGTGTACLGHPLRAAYWLACTMLEREQSLCAGELILSGALGPMIPVAKGNVLQAQIGGLGSVSCHFI